MVLDALFGWSQEREVKKKSFKTTESHQEEEEEVEEEEFTLWRFFTAWASLILVIGFSL